MSFDWLNVPGLNLMDESRDSVLSASPPPTVSFNVAVSDGLKATSNRVQQKTPNQQAHNIITNSSMGNLSEHSEHSVNTETVTSRSNSDTDITSSYVETPQDLKIPLTVSKAQLNIEERRTYLRWYRDLRSRVGSRNITLDDIFNFLSNFNVQEAIKERIGQIFRTCRYSINIEQFCAVLRVVSQAIRYNVLPTRRMILEKAPVLRPKSILSATAGQEVYEEVEEDPNRASDRKVDFDGFASLLLTGQTVRRNIRRRIMKRRDQIKKVRFSHNLVTFNNNLISHIHDSVYGTNGSKEKETKPASSSDSKASDDSSLDLSLPMEQLLMKLSARKKNNSALVTKLPTDQNPESQEEREVLEDMKDSLSHFSQIQKVDNVTQLPNNMLSGGSMNAGYSQHTVEPLKPTATGSANHLFRQTVPPSNASAPSGNAALEPLKPTATGSANGMFRNMFNKSSGNSQPDDFANIHAQPQVSSQQNTNDSKIHFAEPLKPTSTGSANYLMKQQFQEFQPYQSALPPPQPMKAHSNPEFKHQMPYMQGNTGALVNSPQPQLSTSSTLSADGYFQSLLSHSPSPVPTATNPVAPTMHRQPHNMTTYQNNQVNQNNQKFSGSMNMGLSQFSNTMNPQTQAPPRLTVQSPQTTYLQQQNTPRSENILNDLRALQQQVDQLHHTYTYDGRN